MGASTWWRGQRPDLEGLAQYTIMIRAKGDPERRPRTDGPNGRQADPRPHLTIAKTSVDEWAAVILEHLADGRARTFNAIGVELLDKTADVVSGTNFEEALWRLVERFEVEYTPHAPVQFRIIAAGESHDYGPDGGQRLWLGERPARVVRDFRKGPGRWTHVLEFGDGSHETVEQYTDGLRAVLPAEQRSWRERWALEAGAVKRCPGCGLEGAPGQAQLPF